jgi:hypothetical protein
VGHADEPLAFDLSHATVQLEVEQGRRDRARAEPAPFDQSVDVERVLAEEREDPPGFGACRRGRNFFAISARLACGCASPSTFGVSCRYDSRC